MDDLLRKYHILNDSFKKEYVFHLGSGAGFYSEVSNMIFAILYCLKYEYKFILYSKDATFGYKSGWQDFFLPFCSETKFFIHSLYNKRSHKPVIRRKHKLIWYLYRLFNRNTLLTYELWDKYFCKEFDDDQFNIPELNIHNCNLRDAATIISKMIYRYNDETSAEINRYIKHINLPSPYLAMQIRRGDKITECSFCPTQDYFETAHNLSNIKNLFVLTDDYTVIEEIKKDYLEWDIYTLTSPNERGYDNNAFSLMSKLEKKQQLIKLFSSVEIIRMSNLFIGTYTTNLGLFIGMTIPFDKIVSVQKKSWYRFYEDDIQELLK